MLLWFKKYIQVNNTVKSLKVQLYNILIQSTMMHRYETLTFYTV